MRRLILPLMLLVFAGCQPAVMELTEEQKAQIAAEVDSVTAEWWAVWSTAQDFDRFLTFYADEPETVWISDAQPYFTLAAIDEAFRPAAASFQRQDNTPVEWRTIVVAPDVAYTIRINDVVQVDTSGTAGPQVRYAETLVWVKRGGEWKVLLGHGSSPNAPM